MTSEALPNWGSKIQPNSIKKECISDHPMPRPTPGPKQTEMKSQVLVPHCFVKGLMLALEQKDFSLNPASASP